MIIFWLMKVLKNKNNTIWLQARAGGTKGAASSGTSR